MEGWSCAACEQVNPFGMPFCGACGIRDEVERDLWGCRSCGQLSGEAMVFCGRCGQRRGESRPEDLRLVTSLFADISGFTTLADTLDVEDLHAVINPLIAGLAGIAERYDGFVAKYAGDALLCLFGAPTQHEDDAQRALLAALEMQASLPTLLASLGPVAKDLTIHVGVNTGKVVAGAVGSAAQNDYSVLGDSVILAQRLESVCPAGQTYVGESTRELCKDEFDFEDVGELQLKGKLTTVRAFRLVGRRRAGTDASRPLVGRDAELTAALSTLSRDGAVVLSGEPGAGKSRLLAEARLRLTADGRRWLPMRCLSYGVALPYWPFSDLLRQALGLRVEDPVEDVLARLAGALPAELVAGASRLLGNPVDDLEPEAARRQVHDTLVGMLQVLSGGRPLVLAVEDVHWIDSASHEALAELVRASGTRLAVVLTCRPEGLAVAESLASGSATSTVVQLAPLGPEAVPLVAASVLGSPVTGGLATLLVERTRGNPLFVEELSRSLDEDDVLVETSAGLDLRPGVDVEALPDTVERVFAARVDALPLSAVSLLLVAAVIGRVTRLSLLEAVAREEGTDLAPLGELVSSGLLDRVVEQDEPAVSFHHGLLHEAVYGRLLKKQRRLLHRRVADVGRTLYGEGDETVDLLARHLYLAEAGEEALPALLRAARRAEKLYANDAAASHLANALEVLDTLDLPEQRAACLLELAEVRELQGDYDEALGLYEQARASSLSPRAWQGTLSTLRRKGLVEEAQAAFLEAIDSVGRTSPESVPLWLECGWALTALGRPRDAVPVLYTGLKLAAADDASTRGRLHVQLARAELLSGRLEQSSTAVHQALADAEACGDLRIELAALRVLGELSHRNGDLPAARTATTRALELASATGTVEEVAGISLNLGYIVMTLGSLDEAEALVRHAVAGFERIDHGAGRAFAYGNLADVLLQQLRPDEALEWAAKAVAQAEETGNLVIRAEAGENAGRAHADLGNHEEAVLQLTRARSCFEELNDEEGAARCDALLSALSVRA